MSILINTTLPHINVIRFSKQIELIKVELMNELINAYLTTTTTTQ